MKELAQRVRNITLSQAETSNSTIKNDKNNTVNTIKNSKNITYQITHDYTKLPKDQPSLNVLYANVKSIKKEGKIDELKCILKMIPKPVHLILLTETWTKTEDSRAESLQLENYNLVLGNRIGRNGGGVAAYIRKNIHYSTEGFYRNENNYLWVLLNELKLNVGVIYFPGRNNDKKAFLTDLKLQLEKQKDHRAIILGDFNINVLDSHESEDYEGILDDTGFEILNNKSHEYFTRKNIRYNNVTKVSVIDHVCSNLKVGDYHLAFIDSPLSDHRQLYVEIRNPELLPKNREEIGARNLGAAKNSDKDFSPIEKAMIQIMNKIVSNDLKQDDWITEKILEGIALKNLFYQNYQKNPNDKTKEQFDEVNKKENEEREVNKSELKILTLIKSGINKKNVPSKLSVDSKTITDSKEICEQFNIYFSKITSLEHSLPYQPYIPSEVASNSKQNKSMNLLSKMPPCTAKEISEIIVSLDPHASAGIDDINVISIKGSNKNICHTLSTCINDCFDAGLFPDCLKVSKVIPVHKSGWKSKLHNYNFELVLPVFSRILEKLLWKRLYSFVPIHYVTENQYGYREKPNTISPTIDLVTKMSESFDKKKIVLGLFIDLKEALNTVNHSLLFKKLTNLGINGLAHKIIESYFVNRKHVVTMGTFKSNPRDIKQGVPQGSILGHLLFLMYINDVQKLNLKGEITLSAEKISLFYYGVKVEDLFEYAQQDLNSLSKSFQDNSLVMNPKEIHNVIFSNKTKIIRSCKLYLSGIEITEAEQAEYFGLILDSKLTWKPHILKIKSILKLFYENLRSVGHCPQSHGLIFYNTCVRPYTDYLIEVWGAASVGNKTLLQAPHATLKCKLNAIETMQVLSMKQSIFYKTCILVYKIIHKRITQMSFKINGTSRDTRSGELLWVPTPRTKYGQRSLSYSGAVTYNGLPEDVRNAGSIKIFKMKLRTYLGIEKNCKSQQKRQVAKDSANYTTAGSPEVEAQSDEDIKNVEKSKIDKINNSLYECTVCKETDELFNSPHQRKKHRESRHPEIEKKKHVFRRNN